MKRLPRRLLCMTLAVALSVPPQAFVRAEDTDLFVGNTPAPSDPSFNTRPNVLFIIDNSANWSEQAQHWPGGVTQGQSELRALRNVIGGLGSGINVGLMMFTEGAGQAFDGAYMRYAIRQMTEANKTSLRELIGDDTCNVGSINANGTPNCIYRQFNDPTEKIGRAKADYSAAMFEAFKYFGGWTFPADATATPQFAATSGNPQSASEFGPFRYAGNLTNNDYVARLDAGAFVTQWSTYNPPISTANSCAKNYIILIGNGFSTQDAPQSLLSGVRGDTNQILMPQFSTTSGSQTTDLGTDTVCESNAACVTRATAIGGYDSYSCAGGTQASVQTATDNFCESSAACLSRAQSTFPGFASYTCTGGTTTGGQPVSLGTDTVCESNAACAARAATVAGDAVAPFSCTGGTTSAGTPVTLLASTGNVCETPGNCAARAATLFPGQGPYSCTGGNTTPPTCTGQNRVNQTMLGTTGACAAPNLINQSMFGTTAGCTAPNLQGQTMTATPATVCTGSNFLNQTMRGTTTVSTTAPTGNLVTPPTLPSNPVRYGDEWARYLFTTDVNAAPGQQNARTYTIDVFKDLPDAGQNSLLSNMATNGGGKYFQAGSEQAIIDSLQTILTEIQAVNSVFAAASLPVSATNRAQNENQVFFGLFRPDGDSQPRWYGNLKRYQVAKDAAGQLTLADQTPLDANGVGFEAINPASGFFSPCAASFWTTESGTYWSFSANAAGQCSDATRLSLLGATSTYSDLPDGPLVEKGGAGEVLRRGNNPAAPASAVNRTLYTCAGTATCPTASSPGMVAFNNTNVTQSALGAASATERDNIIDYTLGKDVARENPNQTAADPRPSIHGDVVHSRPLPVNYGGSTGVVVYYGGNDGALRAVRAGDATGAGGGQELWSFVAPEHHARLKRLLDNRPLIAYPNVLALDPQPTPAPTPKDYFFDGTMGLFQNADNSKIWIFPTMRRGGRMIYGFDVTSATAPVLKWRAGCPNLGNNSDCTNGFSGIGQTWSTPNVAFIKGFSTAIPAIVVGGGYDNCEDTDSASPSCGGANGRKVYVLNADSGDLLASFDTERSVAADVTLLDRDFDGAVDHAYIADTGGNLYRIDFVDPANPATVRAANAWTITKIASTNSGDSRKFLFPPAAFFGRVNNSDIVILTVGSGDRERPLYTNYPLRTPVLNRFYAFVDLFSTDSSQAINFDTSSTSVIADITTTPANPCLPDIRGWRMDLNGGSSNPITDLRPGEQTVTSSLIAGGKVFFNTHRALVPAAGVCSADLGEARGYSVDLFCGNKFSVVYTGGGLPISPVLGTVTLAGGSVVTFVIGAPGSESATNPYTPGKITPVISPVRKRLFWYRHGDR